MTYLLYNAALRAISPAAHVYLRIHSRHRELLARFAPSVPRFASRPIWVHACSVGEVGAARALIAAVQRRFPGAPVLLTTSTVSGYALAHKNASDYAVSWCPFDSKSAVRRFIARLRPRALVLVETEVWPNLLREAHRSDVPVVLVNGRISEKHFRRYHRFRALFRPVFALLNAAGVQDEVYRDRIVALGSVPDRVVVTGNTKFDAVVTEIDAHTRARVRREIGVPGDHMILLFGSTRPGDEALAAACWKVLREKYPRLHLVVAPRHIDRLGEAIRPFDEPVLRRTELRSGVLPADARVFFLDTVGELVQFYAVADAAVIGGSFYPGVEGHNPLEPAALGVPTVFGPFMKNFAEPARALLDANGARQVERPEDLCAVLDALFADPAERRRIGTLGRRAVLAGRGAIERNIDLIAGVIRKKED